MLRKMLVERSISVRQTLLAAFFILFCCLFVLILYKTVAKRDVTERESREFSVAFVAWQMRSLGWVPAAEQPKRISDLDLSIAAVEAVLVNGKPAIPESRWGKLSRKMAQFAGAAILFLKSAEPRQIGQRLELFVDDEAIDSLNNVRRVLHHPIPAEVVLTFDRPWEGMASYYVTVFKDEDRYKMYYRAWGEPELGRNERTAYAESTDGIHWTKPSLGMYLYAGSTSNNIVWDGPYAESHNFTPFRDTNPDAPDAERYKAIGNSPLAVPFLRDTLSALVSRDGIHWKKMQEAPLDFLKGLGAEQAYDSQNVVFWDSVGHQYVAYFRMWRDVRVIARSTSPDFREWSEPHIIEMGDRAPENFYTNATFPYFRAPHILIAMPMRFVQHRKVTEFRSVTGVSDAVFMTSRDGIHFDRSFTEAFIRPGRDIRDWTARGNTPAWGILPTSDDELSLYVLKQFEHTSVHLQRYTLRTDGFVSVSAPYEGGELFTKTLTFSGAALIVNAETSAAGSIRVEIQDHLGRPIPGFALEDSPSFYGDEIDHIVRWNSGSSVGVLAGKPVRLRFVMRDADLYSFRFSE